MATVYLIHFDRPLHHARHYLGCTSGSLEERLERHATGRGARLMQVVQQAGIPWRLARTWAGDRALERRLKAFKNAPSRLCPICRAARNGGTP